MGKDELKIEIDAELLARARAANLDLARIAESALRDALSSPGLQDQAQAWADQNAEAIAAHRERIEKYGVFGDDLRTW